MPEENTPTTPPKGDEGKTFAQADVDRIVADRLAREKAKYADYDELKAKATKFDEQEAANQSESEKLAGKLTDAEQRAAKAEERALRLEVAQAKGLTPAQAKRLNGSTKEELEADADEILEAFPTQAGATPPPSDKPRPDLKGGTDPTEDADVDIREVVESIPRGI